MIEIKTETCYTIQDLTEGLYVSRSKVYEMMKDGLRYCSFGGKRVVIGSDLMEYLRTPVQPGERHG